MPNPILDDLDPNLHLSTQEATRLAELPISDCDTLEYQGKLKNALFKIYRDGSTDAVKDKWKAQKYLPSKENNAPSSLLRTQSAYDALGLYTSGRLAFSRAKRVVDTSTHLSATTQTVPICGTPVSVASIAGLSYGLELLIDIGVLIKHIVNPDDEEKKLSVGQRFKNTLNKDFRPSRMVNALGWFTINLICILPFARALVGLLNICLFAYDVIHDKVREKYAVHEDQCLLNKLDKRIAKLQSTSLSDAKHCIEYHILLHQKEALVKSAEIANQAKVRSTRISVGIFTGMLLFYFPPFLLFAASTALFYAATEAPRNSYKRAGLTLLGVLATAAAIGVLFFPPAQAAIAALSFGVTIAGAIISLAIGSIYGGLGARIRNGSIGNYCEKIKNKMANTKLGRILDYLSKKILSPIGRFMNNLSRWLDRTYNNQSPKAALESKLKSTPPTLSSTAFSISILPIPENISPTSAIKSDSPPEEKQALLSSPTTPPKKGMKKVESFKSLKALAISIEKSSLKVHPETPRLYPKLPSSPFTSTHSCPLKPKQCTRSVY